MLPPGPGPSLAPSARESLPRDSVGLLALEAASQAARLSSISDLDEPCQDVTRSNVPYPPKIETNKGLKNFQTHNQRKFGQYINNKFEQNAIALFSDEATDQLAT